MSKNHLEEEKKQRRSVVSPNAGLDALVLCNSSDDKSILISAYNSFFGGKAGYTAPIVNEDGSVSLSFPLKGDAEVFCEDQAQKGQYFVLLDANTTTVMAYSNGADGTLYHANSREFQKEDTLEPSGISKNDFVLPKLGQKLGM